MLRSFCLRALLLIWCISNVTAQNSTVNEKVLGHLKEKYPYATDIADYQWIITDQNTDKRNGVTYVYLRQTYQGVEIINANSNMAIKDGKVIHHTGKVISSKPQISEKKHASFSAEEAILKVSNNLNLSITEPLVSYAARTDNPNLTIYSNGGISLEPIPVKRVYWQNEKGELRLAYDLSVYPNDQENWWSIRLDAQTGEILEKHDWVTKCLFDTDPHVHRNNLDHLEPTTLNNLSFGPVGEQYNVFPYPVESPNHGEISLEVAPYDPSYSPFGWHDTNGIAGAEYTITRGNNVYAYEDRDDANAPGFSPNGGTGLDFNFPLNLDLTPLDYQSASITNLFYWNNVIHDIFSHYGFNEQSGNFQTKNYSGQGVGNDAVLAEDQDGSGTENANFATPPEGSAPRMQMYLWNTGGNGLQLIINSPQLLAGAYTASGASFGGNFDNSPSGNLVLVSDGSARPSEGCNTLINSAQISGNIAVIDRGTCAFVDKAINAQNAGAIALLVINNTPGDPINMGGENGESVRIPLLMVNQELGTLIKANLPNVNVSFNDDRRNITSSFDNGIIAHEYGHGISTRLAGGANNSGCLNTTEQMGEGWSDYFALMLTLQPGDQGADAKGIGTYAAGQPTSGRGIRPAPYTTNMAVNGFTYADLSNSAISEPHGIGFLWCTMIWDMTWLMIERHGFDADINEGSGGNNMALQLVIDGLKLQACNPGFIDGCDAILLADQLNNEGANQDIIWEAFARRGLGAMADQGSPNNREDGVVSFDMPASLKISTSVSNAYAVTGDIITFSITVENNFILAQSNIFVSEELPLGLDLIDGSLSEGGSFDGTTIQFGIDQLDGLESVTFSFQAEVTSLTGTAYLFFEDQESVSSNWATTSVTNSNQWTLQSNNPNGGDKAWFVSNPNAISEQILMLTESVMVNEDTKMGILHDFNTEGEYDGGVIEITTNGGANWSDLGANMIQNGYGIRIQLGSDNPLKGRKAFTGTSQGYIKTIIDLGNYAGSEVSIRFRFGSDTGTGGVGWYIDEVLFFVGEEEEIVHEACLTFTNQSEPICATSSTTTLSIEDICIINAGKITTTTPLPITICDAEGTEFTLGNNSISENMQYHYLITSTESPNEILASSSTGTIDHTNLSNGNYLIWGVAFSNDNTQSDATNYLSNINSIEELQLAIDEGDICAHLTNRFSNGNPSQLEKVTCITLSNELPLSKNILLHPNPNNGNLTLTFSELQAGEGNVSVINLTGQTLYSERVQITSEKMDKLIDLTHLSSGMYLVKVEINNETYQGRLVIE